MRRKPAGGRDYRLTLLGGWRLETGAGEVRLPDRPRRLLALLALRGAQTRSVVAETLWPDVVHSRALGSLRSTLFHLVREAPGALGAAADRLSLADGVQVDVADLVRWARTASTGDLPTLPAIATESARLLPGWYDDWVLVEGERLHDLRLTALESTAEALLHHGRHAEALAAALAAAHAEPLRESSHRLVIRAHLTRADVAGAVEHFRRLEALLAVELGVRPSADLRHLVQPHLHPRMRRIAR
ncbi:MAG: AfsR/SARP family transcriptional regulator [Actinomycetota bacterium]